MHLLVSNLWPRFCCYKHKNTEPVQQPKPQWWGVANVFNWYQIFALDTVVVKTQKLCSKHGGFLTIAMHQHTEAI